MALVTLGRNRDHSSSYSFIKGFKIRHWWRLVSGFVSLLLLVVAAWMTITTTSFEYPSLQLAEAIETHYFNLQSPPTEASSLEPLPVYDLKDGKKPPQWLEEVDMDVTFSKRPWPVPIDEAHLQGFYHTGGWAVIMDQKQRILMLRRGPNVVTCPNAWSLYGEHTLARSSDNDDDDDETPLATMQRGLREEVGTLLLQHVQSYRTVTPHPVYYYRDYGPSSSHDDNTGQQQQHRRVDRSLLYLWWIQLDTMHGNDIQLTLDATEGSGYQWIAIEDVEDMVRRGRQSEQAAIQEGLCHYSIVGLLELTLQKTRLAIQKEKMTML